MGTPMQVPNLERVQYTEEQPRRASDFMFTR